MRYAANFTVTWLTNYLCNSKEMCEASFMRSKLKLLGVNRPLSRCRPDLFGLDEKQVGINS